MATKEQLKEWIVNNQHKQGKEGKDGQDFEKVKRKYIELKNSGNVGEAVDYSKGAERARQALGQGLALGFGDEIEAGIRSLGSDDSYEEIRERLRAKNKAYRTDNPKEALGLELGGSLLTGVGGLTRFGLAKGAKTGLGTAMGTNAGMGATYGLGTSESDNYAGLAGDVGVGATIGGVGAGAMQGLGRLFKPVVSDYSKKLAQRAVDRESGYITKGQAVGGLSGRLEEGLGNTIPLIKKARLEGLKGYNDDVVESVFRSTIKSTKKNDPIIKKLNEKFANAETVTDKMRVIDDAVNAQYKKAFEGTDGKGLLIQRNKDIKRELREWFVKNSEGKTKSEVAQLRRLANDFNERLGLSKKGQSAKNMQKTLKDNAYKAGQNVDSNIANTAEAQRELTDLFTRNMIKQNPKSAEVLKNIDDAYGNVVNLRDVIASSAGKEAFTVQQVLKKFAKGTGKTKRANVASRRTKDMDDFVKEEAQRALENTVGDSGTSLGAVSLGSIAGAGGLIASGQLLSPAVIGGIVALGTKIFQYTPSRLKSFNKMIAKGDYRSAMELIEKYGAQSSSGLLGNVGVQSYQEN